MKYIVTPALALLAMTAVVARANNAIVSTIQDAASGSTVTVSGTYTGISTEIKVPSGVTVKGPATFEFTDSETDGIVISTGDTGTKLESLSVTNADHGIICYGTKNTISSCVAFANNNDGIMFENGASSNTATGCTSYDNCDKPTSGGNADGFGDKQDTGSGNQFINCTTYSNSDDGFDFERSTGPVTCTGCLSYTNGNFDGFTGNGEGFKMGYKGYNNLNVYVSCVAHNSTKGDSPYGFSTNNSTAKIKLTTCHSYSNSNKDALGNCVLSNCTMQTSGN